jgi:hypothetical protein
MLWIAAVVAGVRLLNTNPNPALPLPPYAPQHCLAPRQFSFYDGKGKLLYRGGIAGARAQAFANTPLSRLVALFDTGPRPSGCSY